MSFYLYFAGSKSHIDPIETSFTMEIVLKIPDLCEIRNEGKFSSS